MVFALMWASAAGALAHAPLPVQAVAYNNCFPAGTGHPALNLCNDVTLNSGTNVYTPDGEDPPVPQNADDMCDVFCAANGPSNNWIACPGITTSESTGEWVIAGSCSITVDSDALTAAGGEDQGTFAVKASCSKGVGTVCGNSLVGPACGTDQNNPTNDVLDELQWTFTDNFGTIIADSGLESLPAVVKTRTFMFADGHSLSGTWCVTDFWARSDQFAFSQPHAGFYGSIDEACYFLLAYNTNASNTNVPLVALSADSQPGCTLEGEA